MTGITVCQLEWRDKRGLVLAREGHRRIYSWEDLRKVAVVWEPRRKGFSLERMREVVRFLRKSFRDGWRKP